MEISQNNHLYLSHSSFNHPNSAPNYSSFPNQSDMMNQENSSNSGSSYNSEEEYSFENLDNEWNPYDQRRYQEVEEKKDLTPRKPLTRGISFEKISNSENSDKKLSRTNSGEKIQKNRSMCTKKREIPKHTRSFSVSDLKKQLNHPAFNRRGSYDSLMVNSHSSEAIPSQHNFPQPVIDSHQSANSSPLSSSCSPLDYQRWQKPDFQAHDTSFQTFSEKRNILTALIPEKSMEGQHGMELDQQQGVPLQQIDQQNDGQGGAFLASPSINYLQKVNYFAKTQPPNDPKPLQNDFVIINQQNEHNNPEEDVLVQVQYYNNYFQQNAVNPITNQNNFILAINPTPDTNTFPELPWQLSQLQYQQQQQHQHQHQSSAKSTNQWDLKLSAQYELPSSSFSHHQYEFQ